MELACAACGAPLNGDDLNFDYGIGTCRFCRAVTRLPRAEQAAREGSPSTERPHAPRPDRFQVEETIDGVTITWRWFSPLYIFLLFFCIAWNTFLLFWYGMALSMPADGFGILFLVFPLGHVAVGLGLSYFTLAGFLNSTRIQATRHELSIGHSPLPWKGNQAIPVEDLDQLYCQQKVHQGKNHASTTYQVLAALKDGSKRKLLSGLRELDEALYLEQTLEDAFRITDRRMAGDVTG